MNPSVPMDGIIEFAESRITVQDRHEKDLLGSAKRALHRYGQKGWYDALVAKAERLMRQQYHADTGRWTSAALRKSVSEFHSGAVAMMKATHKPEKKDIPVRAAMIARSLAADVVNRATEVAALEDDTPDVLVKTWVSMDDQRVRPTHRIAHGQTVPLDKQFVVGGTLMSRPGDVTAPIEEWANCRCVLAITVEEAKQAASLVASTDRTGAEMAEDQNTPPVEDDEMPPFPDEPIEPADDPVPFWGLLAPEDVESGDQRKFAAESLRARPYPLAFSWQKSNEPGHDGSVRVGNIERAWRRDGMVFYDGHFLTSPPEVDEVIGTMWESGGRIGVSVDADDGEAEMFTRDGQSVMEMMEALEPGGEGIELDMADLITVFTTARVAGATLCNIPAFTQAFGALGEVPEEFAPKDDEMLVVESRADALVAAISEKSWDGSASRYTDEEWKRACILHLSDSLTKADHKLPIREPNGDLSRAGVHAAASRIGQVDAPPEKVNAAKSALRGAYKQLGEDVPDSLTAAVVEAGVTSNPTTEDGPGWLTHPVDTDRLRDYWVRGAGAAKIGWGIPGDFNRCRMHLAKYIKPNYLSGYCANRHKDALGVWPGQEMGGRGKHSLVAAAPFNDEETEMRPAVTFGKYDDLIAPPDEWFDDPHFVTRAPLTITNEGRVMGHLAEWKTCHIGISGMCTEAPPSVSNYAYFRTGYVVTASGAEVPVGNLTYETGHADKRFSAKATMAHYDNTGTVWADVAAGEDEFGIWVSGAVRPGLAPEAVRALRASALSGDWRDIGGNLELVAALSVNVQGFPIPRTAIAASGGRQTALIAAGIVLTAGGEQAMEITVEEIVERTINNLNDKAAARARIEALRARRVSESRAKIEAAAARVRKD